mmetsp:Transcript_82280/g.233301  ORF Transcript_82280/g.233301 Transcript_82280/m.233301 type:complete len:340 (-) Transcript_82280:7-1026(-)
MVFATAGSSMTRPSPSATWAMWLLNRFSSPAILTTTSVLVFAMSATRFSVSTRRSISRRGPQGIPCTSRASCSTLPPLSSGRTLSLTSPRCSASSLMSSTPRPPGARSAWPNASMSPASCPGATPPRRSRSRTSGSSSPFIRLPSLSGDDRCSRKGTTVSSRSSGGSSMTEMRNRWLSDSTARSKPTSFSAGARRKTRMFFAGTRSTISPMHCGSMSLATARSAADSRLPPLITGTSTFTRRLRRTSSRSLSSTRESTSGGSASQSCRTALAFERTMRSQSLTGCLSALRVRRWGCLQTNARADRGPKPSPWQGEHESAMASLLVVVSAGQWDHRTRIT